MSLSSSQMQAQAKPAEDIEDIIELQADMTKVPLEQIIELKDVPLWTGWYSFAHSIVGSFIHPQKKI